MINLVPPSGLKAIKHEYLMRVGVTWGLLFVLVGIAVGMLMIPSYVLVNAQLNALQSEVAGDTSVEKFREAESMVKETNAVVAQLNKELPKTQISEVLEEIRTTAKSNILITRFSVQRTDGVITSLNIVGTADSREALATFKTDIERSPLFETALVPLSSLARESDLPFTIDVTLSGIEE